jgi:hypothetical protein
MTRVLIRSVSLGVLVDLQHGTEAEAEVEAEQFGLILGTAMDVAEEADSWMWCCHVQCCRYLLFTNTHLNAQPLRNKFVIYEAEAVLIDFNGNCGLQNATPYIPDLVHT